MSRWCIDTKWSKIFYLKTQFFSIVILTRTRTLKLFHFLFLSQLMTMQILFIRRNNFPTMWIKIPANRYVHERCMFSTFIALLKWRQHFGAMFWHEGIWVVQPFAVNKLKRKRKEWSTSMNGLHFFWHVFIDAKDKQTC